eukprot:gene6135-7393_t
MGDYDGNIDFTLDNKFVPPHGARKKLHQLLLDAPPLDNSALHPCASCGRTFNTKALAKHAPICQRTKANATRRGAFDITKQRLSDVATSPSPQIKRTSTRHSQSSHHQQQKSSNEISKKKPSWREKHQEFINNIRAARKVQKFINEGGDLASLPPPPPSENPDYVKCSFCGRRFNEDAAKRHMKFCEEQSKRERIKRTAAKDPVAMEKMKRRITYRPPSLKKPATPMKEKSSAGGNMSSTQTTKATPTRRTKHSYEIDERQPRPPTPSQTPHHGTNRTYDRHHSSLKEPTHSETKVNFKVHRHNSGNSRTDVRNGYDRSSTSTPTDLSNSDAVAPILELKGLYPFDRERPHPDDVFLDRHRSNRQGSASSIGSNRSHKLVFEHSRFAVKSLICVHDENEKDYDLYFVS